MNFRYSCTFCNSRRVDAEGGTAGGKQDHFPLSRASRRAWSEADDHDAEVPLLLDPCAPGDPELLTFLPTGAPEPRRAAEEDAEAHDRARISIQLYHLDHVRLVEARKEIWAKVDRLVKRGSGYLAHGAVTQLNDVKRDLHELIRSSAPQARVARLAVRSRRDVGWVAAWLEDVETAL
jgi:hypothetical protein